MNNTKRFFRQIVYTEDFGDSTISGLFKILGKRILADLKVVYDSLEFKLQTILEPESEKNLIFKQNKFPTFSSILEVLGTRQKNKFYPANPSLWVVFVSCFMGILIIIFVSILHSQDFITVVYKQFGVAIVGSILCITFWVSLFYKEKVYGYHTDLIRNNITLSFWIFLFTEGLCFMSLFWTFFHSLLAASSHIGQFAPGEGIVNYYLNEDVVMHPYWSVFLFTDMTDAKVHNFPDDITDKYTYDHTLAVRFHFNLFDCGQLIDPYGYPALNTALLLISATVLNSGHAKLKMGKYLKSFIFLALTLLLGIIFLCVQFLEIKGCTLQYNDGIYACSFYSLTGLHGIHVILGVFALFLCFINFIKGNYTRKRHDTFWCAVAYWHFVDVVWVLVYLLIYCWSSCLYFSDGVRYSYLGYKDYCFNINTKVFEKSLFEKIVNDDIALSFEIINFYVSNPLNAECRTGESILNLLKRTNVKVDALLLSYFDKYESQEPLVLRFPNIDNKKFFEEDEYTGKGYVIQPEFVKEDLRNDPYYKKLRGIASENNYNVGLGSTFLEDYKRLVSEYREGKNQKVWQLKPELFSAVLDHITKQYLPIDNELLKEEGMNTEKKSRKKSIVSLWTTHMKNFNVQPLESSNISLFFNEIDKKEAVMYPFEKLYISINFDNLINEEKKMFLDKNSIFTVLGQPDSSVIDPQYIRSITPKDMEKRKEYFNHFEKILNDLSSGENFAVDNECIDRYLKKRWSFSRMIMKCNKTAEYEKLASDYPLIETFLRNRYFYAYMEKKNDISLEESVFLALNLYDLNVDKYIYQFFTKIPKNWIMNVTQYLNLSRAKKNGGMEFLSELSAHYLANNPSEENDNLFNKIIKKYPKAYTKIPEEEFASYVYARYLTSLANSPEEFRDTISLLALKMTYLKNHEAYRSVQNAMQEHGFNTETEHLFQKYSGIETIRKRHLIEALEHAYGNGSLLDAMGLTIPTNIDYSNIEDRRLKSLALNPIDQAPITLSDCIAKEARKKKAIEKLVLSDIYFQKLMYNNLYPIYIKHVPYDYIDHDNMVFSSDSLYWDLPFKMVGKTFPGVGFHYFDVVDELTKFSGKERSLTNDWHLNVDDYTRADIMEIYNEYYTESILEELNKKKKRLKEIAALKKNKINIHLTYFELYRTRKYMNYSELKNDKHLYAVFLNILHPLAFDYLDRWAVSDFTTWRGKIKFPILFILYFININWAFTFAARFTPYLLTSDFKFIWGDLLYTRKPKWAIKKD